MILDKGNPYPKNKRMKSDTLSKYEQKFGPEFRQAMEELYKEMSTKTPKVKVEVIESERGWGQKVDEVLEFDTLEEANDYIKKFNSGNNLPVTPDWYMYARLA